MRRAACRSRWEHLVVIVVVSAAHVNSGIPHEYNRRRLIVLRSCAPISRIAKERRVLLALRGSLDRRRTLAGTRRFPCPLTDKEEATNAASDRRRRLVPQWGFSPRRSLPSDAILLGRRAKYRNPNRASVNGELKRIWREQRRRRRREERVYNK